MEPILAYTPKLFFDRKEPFYPARVGVSVLRDGESSPSFRRRFAFKDDAVDHVIEFAIYWDYDIQHLYDLEHVWVYVRTDGSVADGEASFHGRYLKALLPDRSNLHGTRLKLYSQPGKHAFSPLPLLFELLPDARICTNEEAGKDGLTLPDWYGGRVRADGETDRLIRTYLHTFRRFTPSFEFIEYEFGEPAETFVPWERLYEEIPARIERELAVIRGELERGSKR
ncbi:hypothetical protein GE107_17120 [Cohnella sp. CFH 77786]|nr:hypothetical protein [Cohnella sp. CFH 77786]